MKKPATHNNNFWDTHQLTQGRMQLKYRLQRIHTVISKLMIITLLRQGQIVVITLRVTV